MPAGAVGGIKVVGEHLLVARGFEGNVSLYDRRTGALRGPVDQRLWPDATNINDIAIAPNGDAYITDSERPVLYRIPAAELREPECRRAGPSRLPRMGGPAVLEL